MDALEKAIRNAFAKGDAEDRAFREKVYRSAFAALDRALQGNPGITVEKAIARRRDLQTKIAMIESEFLPAVRAAGSAARQAPLPESEPQPPDVETPVPEIGAADSAAPRVGPVGPAGDPAAAPPVEAPVSRPDTDRAPEPIAADDARTAASKASPSIDIGRERLAPFAGSATVEEVAPDRNDRRVRQARRSFGSLLLAATVLSGLAIGGWWAYRTGLLGLPDGDGAVPNPPQMVEDEDFVPGGEIVPPPVTGTSPPRNWIDVFSPSDVSGVSTPAGAAAEVMEDDSGSFLRVRSEGAAVIFDVGQGVLEEIAGRKAVFDIVARGAEGKATQISVDCSLGELGDCGRKRYEVGYEKGEYLFEIALPGNRPGAAGSIAVNSDFDNQGKAVDIYQIRVSVVE